MPSSPAFFDSSLLDAADAGDLDEIRRLLAEGRDPNAQKPGSLETPLSAAIFNGNERVFDLLLPVSNAKLRSLGQLTPLMAAARHRDPASVSMARKLVALSEVNAQSDFGETALHLATTWGHLDSVELLAPLADLSLKDRNDRTPLLAALENMRASMVSSSTAANRLAWQKAAALFPWAPPQDQREALAQCRFPEMLHEAAAKREARLLQGVLADASAESGIAARVSTRAPKML